MDVVGSDAVDEPFGLEDGEHVWFGAGEAQRDVLGLGQCLNFAEFRGAL